MNSSFLYHAWGLYTHKCTREGYKGNTIIFHVEAKDCKKNVQSAATVIWLRMVFAYVTLLVFRSVARR